MFIQLNHKQSEFVQSMAINPLNCTASRHCPWMFVLNNLPQRSSFDFKSVYSRFSQKYTTFFSMFQDVSRVFSHVFSHVFTMFQPFWPLGLLRCLRVLLPAQRWDQQFAGGRAAGRHLTLGTYWGGPLRLLREGGCRWMPKIGWMSDGGWWWMILNDGGVPEYDDFSWWVMILMDVLKMVNDGEWLMMVKWWRVQVVVPLLLRVNDDGEWWLMVNYDLPGYGREWMLMDV